MRRLACFIILLAASTGPAPAQPEGAGTGAEAFPLEGKITLALQSVPLADAVAKLGAAARQELRCDPELAQRRVTLITRERPPREVAAGLARAVGGEWRPEDEGLVLRPGDLLRVLTLQESSWLLQRALEPGTPEERKRRSDARREVLKPFLPGQIAAMQAPEGLPAAMLTPAQREHLGLLFSTRAGDRLSGLLATLGRLPDLEKSTVSRSGNTLQIRGLRDDYGRERLHSVPMAADFWEPRKE